MGAAVVTNTGEHFAFATDLRTGESVFMSPHFIEEVSTFQRGDLIEWEGDERYRPRAGQTPYRARAARLAGLRLDGWELSSALGRFVDPAYGQKFPVLPEILARFPDTVSLGFCGRFAVIEGTTDALKGALAEVPLVNMGTGSATSFFLVVSHPHRRGQVAVLNLEGNLWGRPAIECNRHMMLVAGRSSVGEQLGEFEELIWREREGRLLVSVVKVDVCYRGRTSYSRLRDMTWGSSALDWSARMIIYNPH